VRRSRRSGRSDEWLCCSTDKDRFHYLRSTRVRNRDLNHDGVNEEGLAQKQCRIRSVFFGRRGDERRRRVENEKKVRRGKLESV
jgi:hypothetical protein